MPPLLWLVVAFLVGLLLEWSLEIFFFRRRMFERAELERTRHTQALREWTAKIGTLQATIGDRDKELASARAANAKLQSDMDACAVARANLEQEKAGSQAHLGQLETDLAAALQAKSNLEIGLEAREAEWAGLRADLDAEAAQTKRLKAEVLKFTDAATVARTTISTLEADKARLTTQVIELQAQLREASADAMTSLQARARLESDLKAREDELAQLRAELDSHLAQTKSMQANVAHLTAGAATATATIQSLEDQRAELEGQLGRIKSELSACASARASLETELKARDAEIERLRVYTIPAPPISTVGPAIEAPAALTPKTVAAWRNRSPDDETPFGTPCPQHLSDVNGIGSVYENRLYAAGVGTFWELSKLSDDELLNVLKMTELQAYRIDLGAIRADARRLAKETRSMGRKWLRCPPDDFEPLQGIGFTFEKRLYDAGICTFEALASATVELLEEICHAPALFRPAYAAWIEQAQVLAAEKAKRQNKA